MSDYAGAVMPDMAGMALPALSEEEVLELQREEFNEAMDPLRPLFAKSAVKTKEICLVGNPGDEISAFARKRKLDIIVMGSSRLRALQERSHGLGRHAHRSVEQCAASGNSARLANSVIFG